MPRINVLEVRHAGAETGPWGEPIARRLAHDLAVAREWSAPDHEVNASTWVQSRVVTYERVEVREGREVPEPLADAPAGRNVLGYYGKLGVGWQISRYNFAECRWESLRPFLGTPDEWRELPEAPK
jgi:hypothetical protein